MSYSGTSYLSSPDTTSSLFPDRLIRPLPKRSLKSRLSQEAAEVIEYPPALPSTSLPTYSHYGENGEYLNDSKVLVQNGDIYDEHDHYHDHEHEHEHEHDQCPHHHHCHDDEEEDDELDSADDSSPVALRQASSYRSSPRSPRSARHVRYGSQSKGSISGPDGYEAFENTNNKKKRKIPTSGGLSLHHSSLTSDLAHLGISGNDGAGDEYGNQGGAPNSGLGVQGAGRGHFVRRGGTRRPLGPSMNGPNLKSSKYDQNMSATAQAEDSKDQGIISAAIANATALLRRPLGKGQENVGVLDQQVKQAPANSQFTFTCEAEAKGVTFPEQSLYSPGYSQRANHLGPPHATGSQKVSNTQGTQTSPNMNSQASQGGDPQQPNTNAPGKKSRRRRGDVYVLAARQRKLQQEYSNIQHPPAPEDIWICEFCEYEAIFGQPPHALIRQYEIKDRKERRRLAEKRRLLEKAKLKGRKGKKQTKNAAKAASNAAHQAANQQGYDQQPLDQLGDDDLDYGYDDDPIPMPAPPPAPTKQPMPGTYDTVGKGGGGTREGGIR